jgi:hypothetical protein
MSTLVTATTVEFNLTYLLGEKRVELVIHIRLPAPSKLSAERFGKKDTAGNRGPLALASWDSYKKGRFI